ncbi:Rrf2 family transcriptional regulator [Pseudochelatococcus contaminans]|uniref:Rrf2 family transcriptional regulator n=1 Tax=Pseudochelatococcus contaminans TaxID=1538103 RepID=UPI001611DDE7|nr:Rrf2 family transcriptional regulator [Pseudochelatococcus contaminans]
MRLTNFSDYSLRMLLYAATCRDRLITIEETADLYGISRHHLMKVANQLTQAGFLKAIRGRHGGLELARDAAEIRLGDVLRATEPDFALVECFAPVKPNGSVCRISASCRLRGVLAEALQAFMETMDRYTLADVLLSPDDFGLQPAA